MTLPGASPIVSYMANQLTGLDQIFAALADPTRRAIVMRLCAGEASVGELADPFDMALPSFMKHIHVLETSGLVQSEKAGRVRTCRLKPDALLGAEDWFQQQRAIWEARLGPNHCGRCFGSDHASNTSARGASIARGPCGDDEGVIANPGISKFGVLAHRRFAETDAAPATGRTSPGPRSRAHPVTARD